MRTSTHLRARLAALALVTTSLAAVPAAAQDPAAGAAPAAPPQTAGAVPPKVIAVRSDHSGQPNRVGLGDRLSVKVDSLQGLLAMTGGDCQKIVLFLDDMAYPCTKPLACEPGGNVVFQLSRAYEEGCAAADLQDNHWHLLFGRPTSFVRPMRVSVGATDDLPLRSDVQGFELQMVSRRGFYFGSVLLIVLWFFMIHLGRKTNLLRDTQALVAPGAKRPYSLSRFQMGFWFLLVVSAFLFIWTLTNEIDTITLSILGLLGIGSGTALGATLIDSSKQTTQATQQSQLQGEKAALQQSVATLAAQAPADPATQAQVQTQVAVRQVRVAEIEGQLAQTGAPIKTASSGSFLRDILNNDAGMSLHRFQMFVWTIVLGIVFCVGVYRRLTMPDFNTTLLGLMGISSGTYLGFKFPERYSPSATPSTSNPTSLAPPPTGP